MNNYIDRHTLREASKLLAEQWLAESEAGAVCPEPALSFRQRMTELLYHNKERLRKRSRRLRYAAIIAAMLVIVLFSWLALDKTARARVAEWFQSIIENSIFYRFEGDARDGAFPLYRLGWMPEGGTLAWEEEDLQAESYSICISYLEKTISFDYGKYYDGTALAVSDLGAGMQHFQFTVGKQLIDAYYREESDDYDYVWMDEENMLYFSLYSSFDNEINRKIIEQLRQE